MGINSELLQSAQSINPILKKKTSGNYVSITWDFNIKHFTEF